MLELLRAKCSVRLFDRAPRVSNRWYAVLRQLVMPLAFFVWAVRHPTGRLYLALSGGAGQLFDWPYVLIGRLLGRCIFVHHHSFAYINTPSMLSRLLFGSLRCQIHIVLSVRMGQELVRIYGLNSANVRVISNAAFFAGHTQPAERPHNADAPISLGYLSNVSVEKGIVEFFAVLEELRRLGVAYKAQIAGPVAPGAQAIFSGLLTSSHNTTYCGALYDEAKADFYNSVDVLLFPTDYANEAEPLVIHEAIRSGVHVIACQRGAIGDILANEAGLVVSKPDFTPSAVRLICALDADRFELKRVQRASVEQATRMRDAAGGHLSAMLDEIADAADGSLQTC